MKVERLSIQARMTRMETMSEGSADSEVKEALAEHHGTPHGTPHGSNGQKMSKEKPCEQTITNIKVFLGCEQTCGKKTHGTCWKFLGV